MNRSDFVSSLTLEAKESSVALRLSTPRRTQLRRKSAGRATAQIRLRYLGRVQGKA